MDKHDVILHELYYNLKKSPVAYSSVQNLYKSAKKLIPSLRLKDVKNWFRSQYAATIHRPARRRFSRNKIIIKAPEEQFQADLIDVARYRKANKDHTFILTVIDGFTKYGWAIPIRRKTGKEVAAALEKIFKQSTPLRFQVDSGKEFDNAQVKQVLSNYGIEYWRAKSPGIKASLVERWNRTLMTRLQKYFTENGTHHYLDMLADLVNAYNRTQHTSTAFAPINAYNHASQIRRRLYPPTKSEKYKFQIGDHVRLARLRGVFQKGYDVNWTDEIFVISERNKRATRPVYKLKDLNGELISGGGFYSEELQLVNLPETFRVEKVLKKKGDKALIRWRGYGPEFDSWEPLRNVKKTSLPRK